MNEREIFIEALEKETAKERQAYLDAACGEHTPLRSRIELLLKSHVSAGSLLDHPVLDHPVLGQGVTRTVARDIDDSPAEQPVDSPIRLGFLPPAEHPEHLGRLGQYEVLEVVGRGGMGLVFKAQDTKLHRVVALKVLLPELAANPTARKRFLREARAAAAVSHDHVVTIHAVEESEAADGPTATLPYLVMEFIHGQSLQQKIDRQGPLELREILRIGMQVASGLAAAHAQGLIHRDVKPSNILLQNGIERVQITDFGLARAADDAAVTRTGEVAGTPQYMSPEQAQGHDVDARSDLFSLGCVLYAMCTGRSPFRADTTMASLHRVCHDTPRPIREVNPEIPKWLSAIINRLLEKKPEDRFQTAGEVAELLGQSLARVQHPDSSPLPFGASPVKRRKPAPTSGRRWLIAAKIVLILAAGFGVSEATGVTHVSGTVIRIVTGEGTLVIEVDDPSVQVSLDGEELSITGAGIRELKLRPGEYKLWAVKDGQPVKREIISITRGGRHVVRVIRQDNWVAATVTNRGEVFEIAHQLAAQERWLEALAAFERAETLPDDGTRANGEEWKYRLLLYLKTNNQPKLKRALTEWYSNFPRDDIVGISLGSMCLILGQLSPQPVDPPPKVIEWLSQFRETRTTGSPPETVPDGKWHDNVSSLALQLWEYRQDNYRRALEFQEWNDEWYPHYHAVSCFVHSMAHAQLQDTKNAKKFYEEAIRIQSLHVPPRGTTVFDERRFKPLWYVWAIYDIAHAQAEDLLAARGIIARTKSGSSAATAGKMFVVLNDDGAEVARFDTLANAVLGSSAGDTIEIRGNGPFVTDFVEIKHPLIIRAGEGFRPLVKSNPEESVQDDWPMLLAHGGGRLVLEGLDLEHARDRGANAAIVAQGPIRMVNCRVFVAQGIDRGCVWCDSDAEFRNSLLIAPRTWGAVGWRPRSSGQRLIIDNCALLGGVVMHGVHAVGPTAEIRHSTLSASTAFGYFFESEPAENAAFQVTLTRNNVQASECVLNVRYSADLAQANDSEKAKALLLRAIRWQEDSNVYHAANLFLQANGPDDASLGLDIPNDLSAWNRLWGLENRGSTQSVFRFQGGELHAKAESRPEQVTPDGFRLRPDSAGPDGKDLGANIDLVGPGAAYERWKKTPEYQEWLKVALQPAESAAAQSPDRGINPDRRAAEWVLSIGGTIKVHPGDKKNEITKVGDLPAGRFPLRNVMLGENPFLDDAGLAKLQNLEHLETLLLYKTRITDRGLIHLGKLQSLKVLYLGYTEIGDAGLAHLAALENLLLLSLYDTRVSDEGLPHLQGLKKLVDLNLSKTQVSDEGLKHLYPLTTLQDVILRDTQVTAAGVAALQAALPKCKIVWSEKAPGQSP